MAPLGIVTYYLTVVNPYCTLITEINFHKKARQGSTSGNPEDSQA